MSAVEVQLKCVGGVGYSRNVCFCSQITPLRDGNTFLAVVFIRSCGWEV